jgi:type IV secretion system protein VirD4
VSAAPLLPLPAPRALLAALLAVLGVAGLAAGLPWLRHAGARGRGRGRTGDGGGSSPCAGWARRRDLADLRVRRPPGDRVVLGRTAGRLVAVERHHSLLVVGPTQSGKTSRLAVPALLEWDGPALAASVKDDLMRATVAERARRGPVAVYDPGGTTGWPSAGWSPLAGCERYGAARRRASALVAAGRCDGGLEDAAFWYRLAEKLLGVLLFAAARAGTGLSGLLAWVDEGEVEGVLSVLEGAGDPAALRAGRASLLREERQRASVYATVEAVTDALADEGVLAAAARVGVDAGRLLEGGCGTLYCCAPAREQERLAPVFTALVREVLDEAFERSARRGAPLEPPLLVVLDEAAHVAPLPELDRLAATAAAHGVALVTVWQDLAQIEARYGARAATLVNNHRAKLACSGVSDPPTLERFSLLAGEALVPEHTETAGPGRSYSRTTAQGSRRLLPADALRRLVPGDAVLVYGHRAPAVVHLRELARRRHPRRGRREPRGGGR